MARRWWLATLLACVAGCGASHQRAATSAHATTAPRLQGTHPCPGVSGFSCASLTVPLDYAGQAAGALHLAVGVQEGGDAPRGVLVFLTGGPGQPGVPLINHVRARLGNALNGYRLVMFDQRGTGAAALRCPALQAAAGGSDLVVPPPGAVPACARAIGVKRRFFTTPETVADLERLRLALHADRITLDGVSYGTYVAERYALTHPTRVARLVLDSVVPQGGVDATYLAAVQATARVLRGLCAPGHCGWDPARDVQRIVQTRRDGPALLDALVAESVGVPAFTGVLGLLHAAAAGHAAGLDRFLAAVRQGDQAAADVLSQGLHQSTLCLDLAAPYDPAAPMPARIAALTAQVGRLAPASVFPFGRATVLGNGLAQGCLQWPATTPPGVFDGDPAAKLPSVPVLILSGDRDLSTPQAWARAELALAPDARLVVIPNTGHSVQTRSGNAVARVAVARFLGAKAGS
jgi:pimeloyl-ACP methyl ester carboxylesterase